MTPRSVRGHIPCTSKYPLPRETRLPARSAGSLIWGNARPKWRPPAGQNFLIEISPPLASWRHYQGAHPNIPLPREARLIARGAGSLFFGAPEPPLAPENGRTYPRLPPPIRLAARPQYPATGALPPQKGLSGEILRAEAKEFVTRPWPPPLTRTSEKYPLPREPRFAPR